MGMLEDERRGLTADQADESRAMYLHSIDPENNPDPNAPEPIPMFAPGEEPGVQPEAAYTNNVQAPEIDKEDPFAEFDIPAAEEDEDPFAEFDDPSAEYAEEEDPFSAYPPVEPEPKPEPEPETEEEGGFLDAAVGGIKKAYLAVKTEINSLLGDAEAVETLAAESQGIKGTKAQEDFSKALAANSEQDETLWDGISNVLGAAHDQPLGAAHEMTAQAGNMAPILGGAYVGMKAGAAGGLIVGGPPGAIIGGIVGSIAGMFAGNMAIEGGFAQQEEALKPGVITQEQMTEANIGAAKKAGVITGIDMLTMGANRLMMGAPGRAASAATSRFLSSKGVDVADEAATLAAFRASPELMGEAMEVSARAMADATGTIIGKKGVRGAVGMGLETVGEGTGEYLGTLASGKDASFTEAALEAFMAGPTSAAELAFVSTYKMAKAKLGPTVEAAATLDADMDALDETLAPEEITGPLPQTPEAAEAELETQALEAEQRVADIENAQDSARERVLANGGDLLDAELEASKVAEDMGAAEDDIKRHLAMVNRQTEKGIERREAEAKEKEQVTKENAKSKIQESRKRIEEDKAYEQVDKVSGLGQTGDVGHIAADTATDETVAGEKGDGVVRGNQLAEAFNRAANEAATSPTNELKEPTPAQAEAGNYKKGHVRKHGLDITIENPAGSTRKAADGSWEQNMKDHYGYIKGTESAEGKNEQLDVFIGEGEGIFVVDQINEDGTFDEHKVMMGYGNSVEARRAYARNYPQGFKVGKITPMSPQKFKEWLKNGDQTQPVANAGGPVAASAGQKKEVILSETLEAKRDTRTLSASEQAEDRLEKMPGRKVRYRLEDQVKSDELISRVEKDGDGFTVDSATGEAKKDGFAAGIGMEEQFKERPTPADIDKYREAHADALAEPGNYLGGWMDGGVFFLDVSKVYPNNDMGKQRAYKDAKSRGEYGIQDLSKPPEEGYIPIEYETGEMDRNRAGGDLTKTPGFKKFFGKSKVVDEKGAPLKVYRGEYSMKGEEPRELETKNRATLTFTDAKGVADVYATDPNAYNDAEGMTGQNTGSYYINIEKPLDLTRYDEPVAELDALRRQVPKEYHAELHAALDKATSWREEGMEVSGSSADMAGDVITDSYRLADSEELVAVLKKAGFDGMIIYGDFNMGPEELENRGLSTENIKDYWAKEFRPFDVTQVKSAIGNRGTFDAKEKNVRYRREEADGDKYFDEQAFKDVGPRFNSRTTLVYMSPDEFLQMAEKMRFPDEQKAREVKELADEGTAYNSLPFLAFDNEGSYGQTVQHEGRHRAMELKSRGVKSMPVKLTSGEQGSKSSFRWDDNNLTLPKTLKGQSGNEIAFPEDAYQAPPAKEEPAKDGRAFKNFFSAVTKGLTGTSSTGAAYKPVISAVGDMMSDTASAVSKYSTEYIKHRGKFDDHIAFSIPGYKEVQQAVGSALSQIYSGSHELLDVGASEGSFAKAVTALSGMKSTSLDPNPDMERSFNDVSSVPGAEYSMTALGEADQEGEVAWTEDDGTEIQYFDPMGKQYDVVHEAMVFQFVSNGREEQFKRIKQLVKADGLFITEEKVFTPNQAANEKKKNDDHKSLYFEQKDLDAKSAEVLEGMHENMVHDFTIEEELTKNFKYVAQFWDSGNFKGYMASDSKATLENALDFMPDMNSEFSTATTPRNVSAKGLKQRLEGNEAVNVPMTSAKAKLLVAPLVEQMPRLAPQILANPSEAPAALRAQMEKDNAMKAKGVFDPETGKLYIFSENHDSDADLVRTLLHEGVAHKGLRILLGDKFEKTMQDVFANGDRGAMDRIARRYGLDPTDAEDKVEIAEEYIAFLAEHDVKSTVLQRVVAAIRRVFRAVGPVKNWSDNDIHGLLRRSRRGLKGKPMRKAMIKKSFILEGTGEVVEVETSADVELRNIQKRKDACERLRKCVK